MGEKEMKQNVASKKSKNTMSNKTPDKQVKNRGVLLLTTMTKNVRN